MKFPGCVLLALLAAVTSMPASQAQQVRTGAGLSYGPTLVAGSIRCEGCSDSSFAGLGGYLRVGGYLREDLFAGVEGALHTLPLPYLRYDTRSLAVVMQWYPAAGKGFHLGGSLGLVQLVEVDNEDEDTQRRTLTAPALGISVGHDIRTRRRFLLTPFITYTHVPRDDYKVNGTTVGSASGSQVQLGLGFTWY